MALEIFRAISNLRMVLDTETDYDSPDNETTYKAVREMIEILFQLMLDTNEVGTATSDPPDDATGVLTDTGAAMSVDEHNGRTLVICSGSAKGNFYTIDDTTATTIVCTGDNLYSDGVRSGDDYKVLYDVKTNTSGHDHDGVNSPTVVLADGQVVEAKIGAAAVALSKLKTSTQSQSQDIAATSWHKFTLTGGEYCFRPTYKGEDANIQVENTVLATTTSYATITKMRNAHATLARFAYVLHRYVTSSGEVYWIFILRDKLTKKIIGVSACPDHPCFGNSQKPELEPHPFGDAYDPGKHEIIVINPSKEQVLEMQKKTVVESETEHNKSLSQVIAEDFEIDETIEPDWPTEAVTVGLPPEWEEVPIGGMIKPIKKVIPRPTYVKTAALKIKEIKEQP